MKSCVCSPLFPKGWIIAAAIVVALVSLWAIAEIIWRPAYREPMSRATSSASELTELPAQSLRERLLNWPLPPAPPVTVKVERPDVPTELPPVHVINGEFVHRDLAERFRILVQRHPSPEISHELDRLIGNRTMRLNWETRERASAEFIVVRREDVLHGITEIPADEKLVLFLGINRNWIAQLTGLAGVLEGMATISHEFQHYEQWRDTPPEKKEMWLRAGLEDGIKRFGPELCDLMLSNEIDAHAVECGLRKQWGLDSSVIWELCVYEGTPHFEQAAFLYLTRGSFDTPGIERLCGTRFAHTAGHPNFQ